MLAAHLDTMPIGNSDLWTVDATEGIIKDGKVWGRGACDDKYALATWFFIAKAMQELGIQPENDIYLTGYVDEEYGGGDAACRRGKAAGEGTEDALFLHGFFNALGKEIAKAR